MTLEVINLYEDGELKEFTCTVPSKDNSVGSFRLEVDFYDSARKEIRVSAKNFRTDSLDFLVDVISALSNSTEKSATKDDQDYKEFKEKVERSIREFERTIKKRATELENKCL